MDMLGGLGNINLDLGSMPPLPSLDTAGIPDGPRQYPSITEANKAMEGLDGAKASDVVTTGAIEGTEGARRAEGSADGKPTKKPSFNHINAGLKALDGATLGLGKQALSLLQQKPLESLATVGAIGTLAVLGGPPALLLMGALGAVGAKLAGFQQFSEAGKKADAARAAANDFRFEEAQQLMSESQAVWGNVGIALGTAGLAGLVAKRGLGVNAASKGVQLAKGVGGYFKELFAGITKPGYWASAPQAGNVFSASTSVIKGKTAEPFAKLTTQAKQFGSQASQQAKALGQKGQVFAQAATEKGQAFAGQATEQGQGWLAKAKTQAQATVAKAKQAMPSPSTTEGPVVSPVVTASTPSASAGGSPTDP
jgi:hypothetical protein